MSALSGGAWSVTAILRFHGIAAEPDQVRQKVASDVQQIAAKQAEGVENTAGIVRLQTSLPFLQQKRDMYRSLKRDGLSQVPAWADAEQAYSDQAQQIAVLQRHAAEIEASRVGLLRTLAQDRASYAHDVFKDLADAEQKAGEFSAELSAAARKAEETVLAAPIAGTVQQLAAHTIGGVVTAAEPLLTVVPDAAPVLIEATVENRDVGFVHPGQPVEVKVETFTFTRYGLLHGRVVDISRDAAAAAPKQQDETDSRDNGDPAMDQHAPSIAYVAHVALDRDRLFVDGREQAIAPGMAVTAEIKTGRRSVISYLLSPLQKSLSESYSER